MQTSRVLYGLTWFVGSSGRKNYPCAFSFDWLITKTKTKKDNPLKTFVWPCNSHEPLYVGSSSGGGGGGH